LEYSCAFKAASGEVESESPVAVTGLFKIQVAENALHPGNHGCNGGLAALLEFAELEDGGDVEILLVSEVVGFEELGEEVAACGEQLGSLINFALHCLFDLVAVEVFVVGEGEEAIGDDLHLDLSLLALLHYELKIVEPFLVAPHL
jgi:hypothetical protein